MSSAVCVSFSPGVRPQPLDGPDMSMVFRNIAYSVVTSKSFDEEGEAIDKKRISTITNDIYGLVNVLNLRRRSYWIAFEI